MTVRGKEIRGEAGSGVQHTHDTAKIASSTNDLASVYFHLDQIFRTIEINEMAVITRNEWTMTGAVVSAIAVAELPQGLRLEVDEENSDDGNEQSSLEF